MRQTEVPLGYITATATLKHGRAAFFGSAEADIPLARSATLQQDDMVPQFGFVGPDYATTRVLLLGINPGNGPKARDHRSATDERMMPALAAFAAAPSQEAFVAAQIAYRTECQTWAVWRNHCSEVIRAGGLSLEQVAYSNVLPWRTNSESAFSDDVGRRAAKLYALPLIEELKPNVIVALGKRAATVLSLGDRTFPDLIVWNRAQAATTAVRIERASTAERILAMVAAKNSR